MDYEGDINTIVGVTKLGTGTISGSWQSPSSIRTNVGFTVTNPSACNGCVFTIVTDGSSTPTVTSVSVTASGTGNFQAGDIINITQAELQAAEHVGGNSVSAI